jgi:hypothetical protein
MIGQTENHLTAGLGSSYNYLVRIDHPRRTGSPAVAYLSNFFCLFLFTNIRSRIKINETPEIKILGFVVNLVKHWCSLVDAEQ